MSDLTWESLNTALFEEFPVLKSDEYIELIGGIGWSPGQYVVFGDIFNAYLRKSVVGPSADRAKAAEFLERMAISNVLNMEDLLKIEVLPTLLIEQGMITAYWPHLGPKTRWMLDVIAPRIAPKIVLPPLAEGANPEAPRYE